jgi:hypothetical protein
MKKEKCWKKQCWRVYYTHETTSLAFEVFFHVPLGHERAWMTPWYRRPLLLVVGVGGVSHLHRRWKIEGWKVGVVLLDFLGNLTTYILSPFAICLGFSLQKLFLSMSRCALFSLYLFLYLYCLRSFVRKLN